MFDDIKSRLSRVLRRHLKIRNDHFFKLGLIQIANLPLRFGQVFKSDSIQLRWGWEFFISCLQNDFHKDPQQVEPRFCRSLLTTKFVDVAPIGVVINMWNLSWWQQLCDVSKRRVDRTRRLLDQICMYCSKLNWWKCLYYPRIVHLIQIRLAI